MVIVFKFVLPVLLYLLVEGFKRALEISLNEIEESCFLRRFFGQKVPNCVSVAERAASHCDKLGYIDQKLEVLWQVPRHHLKGSFNLLLNAVGVPFGVSNRFLVLNVAH